MTLRNCCQEPGAVAGRRLVEVARDALQAGEQQKREEREAVPDLDHQRRRQRRVGIGEPSLVVIEHADLHQQVVDHAEPRIEHQRPHMAGDHVGQEPGQQHEHAEQLGSRAGRG